MIYEWQGGGGGQTNVRMAGLIRKRILRFKI
jgi:hypothetical protein